MNTKLAVWIFALGALLTAGGAFAQTPTGAIEGTVTDASGAVVPNAKVTITETAIGRAVTIVTDISGRYVLRNLEPGMYTVKVEASGFSIKELRNLSVSSGAVVNGSVQLQVGQTGEVVQVTAEAVMVDTSRQTVDTVITENEIKKLPVFSRNFLDLAALAPGVYIRDGGDIDPTKEFAYRTVGIAGRSGTGTRVQVDGIDVTDETVGTTVANISMEGVSEFQLTRSSLDPSTSLTSSGAVNIISKTGTNDLHGSWFWDYYNQDMGARLQYNKEAAPFKRDRTGGGVGGPMIKDRIFWYADWERTYQTAQDVFDAPDFDLHVSQDFPVGIRYTDGRVDWNLSSAWRLFYRFHHDWNLATGGSAVSPFQNVNWTNTSTVGLTFTTARTTHNYRFGYVNFNNRIESQELKTKFPRVGTLPYYLGVGSYAVGPNSLAPQQTYQDNFQNSYEGSLLAGRQTLRYGFDYRRIVLGGFANFAGPLSVSGSYDRDTIEQVRRRGGNVKDPLEYPLEAFTTGPQNGFFNFRAAHNLPYGGKYNDRIAWFVQDSLKLARRLTVNLGVRWQYDTGYFPNDRRVPRDPNMERWIRGASKFPEAPKNLFSPSFGFAFDPTGSGKTSIRGGFYRAYEMNILNNTMFDEFSMLPPGIGPDAYDITNVAGPDGTPINVDGRHPDGSYEDLIGQPIKNVIGMIGQVHQALNAAYSGFKFDPTKGESLFTQLRGITFGGQIPGNQFKVPYAIQFNIGVQHELRPGAVLSVDYIHNHGVGLPFFLVDYERRRDAGTLNAAAARTQRDRVLGGRTVDEWIAANPTRNISAFGLINDTIWQGLYPDFSRARFFTGGFTRYRGLQASLRGSPRSVGLLKLKDVGYNLSYALGRGETAGAVSRVEFLAGPLDNRKWNSKETFGPNNLDFTHMLSAALLMTTPGGFQLNSFWWFRTAGAQTLGAPNLGGAISGIQGFFGTDVNGDGGVGTAPRGDVLPGLNAGQFGRKVKSFKDLNQIIQNFNQNYAGKLTPHGQALVAAGLFSEAQLQRLGAVIPTVPLVPENNPNPWHNVLTTDLRFSRPVSLARLREGVELTPFVDFINLFNHAPAGLYGGLAGRFGALNFDYSKAGAGQQASDLDQQRHRLNATRKVQIGIRVDF